MGRRTCLLIGRDQPKVVLPNIFWNVGVIRATYSYKLKITHIVLNQIPLYHIISQHITLHSTLLHTYMYTSYIYNYIYMMFYMTTCTSLHIYNIHIHTYISYAHTLHTHATSWISLEHICPQLWRCRRPRWNLAPSWGFWCLASAHKWWQLSSNSWLVAHGTAYGLPELDGTWKVLDFPPPQRHLERKHGTAQYHPNIAFIGKGLSNHPSRGHMSQ